MNRFKSALAIAAIVISTLPLLAQDKKAVSTGGLSPHETISQTFDGSRNNRVTLIYGRPYTKSPTSGEVRKIWGGLVPYGKVWRTGSDEATILALQKSIVIGEATIPAGAYTLFTLPQTNGAAKLIINKQVGQWGVGPGAYDEKQDLARVDLKQEALPADKSVDQFTMAIEKNSAGGGILKMMWETNQYSVAFTIAK